MQLPGRDDAEDTVEIFAPCADSSVDVRDHAHSPLDVPAISQHPTAIGQCRVGVPRHGCGCSLGLRVDHCRNG